MRSGCVANIDLDRELWWSCEDAGNNSDGIVNEIPRQTAIWIKVKVVV